jgi:hypothetical protein
MTDDLERRLRRADPARSAHPHGASVPSIRDLMEATMESPTTTRASTRRPAARWAPAAAAAVLVLAGVTGAVTLTGDDAPPTTAPTTMALSLPDPAMMSSCLQYSVEFLAQMPTAFSGTVVDADADSVVLEVDRWYRGGDADTVELANPSGPMRAIDGVEFSPGGRYLVTAGEDGTVSTCGFTAGWSAPMAADFEKAFGG